MLKTSSIAIFLLTFIISPLSVAQNPCSGKIEMLCGQSYVYTLASGSGSWNPTGPWGTPGDEAIFFFNPPSDGLYNITITNNDFYVNLFSKTANCGKQNWQYQDRVNAAGVISLNLLAGVTYHFLIDDENTTESSGTINIACLNLLPVELIAFEGQNAGRQNKLRWITASEVDNDYFIVERSDDGVAFEQIAKIEGQGTTTVQTDYDYTDITFQSPTNYYRLTQVDFNGDLSLIHI